MSEILTEETQSAGVQGFLDPDAAFPVDALGDTPIARMVKELARVEQVPVKLPVLACLSAVSAACLGGIGVKSIRGKVATPHLYVLVGAGSGVGKSEVVKQAFAPVERLEIATMQNWQTTIQPGLLAQKAMLEKQATVLAKSTKGDSIINPAAADVKQLAAVNAQLDEVQRSLHVPRLVYEDCTQEALALGLSYNGGKLSLVSSDGRKVIKNLMGAYKAGETDEDVLLKGFSGDPIRVDRTGRDAGPPVPNPQLSVFLAVQPDLFGKFVGNATFLESGLVARFLVVSVLAEPNHINVDGAGDVIDPGVISAYGAWLSDIANTFRIGWSVPIPAVIDVEPAAREAIIAFTNECVDLQCGELGDIGPCVARWGELAWRLALVLHVAHYGKQAVEQPLCHYFADQAVLLMKWFAAQQVQVLNAGRHQKKVERLGKLVQVLSRAPDNWVTHRDLDRKHGFKKPELEQLVNENVALLVMETAPSGPDGGRPSPRIRMLG